MMGLRLTEGIDLDRLATLSGFAPHSGAVAELAEGGLVDCSGNRLIATASGRIVLDKVVLRLSTALTPVECASTC
jgi:oxygen-independent coproporphyrinogen-3 oxidase